MDSSACLRRAAAPPCRVAAAALRPGPLQRRAAAAAARAAFATSAAERWVAGVSPDPASLPPDERSMPGTCRWTYKTICYQPRRLPRAPPCLLRPPPNLKRKCVLPPDAVTVEAAYPFAGPVPAAVPVDISTLAAAVRREKADRAARDDPRLRLFSPDTRNRVLPGDVVVVETWNSLSAKRAKSSSWPAENQQQQQPAAGGGDPGAPSVTRFAGVVVKITHRGVASSFVVRNVVQGVGTNLHFPICSPLIKSIRVAKRKVLLVPRKLLPTAPAFKAEKAKATLNRSFSVKELYAAVKEKEAFWATARD